MQEALSYQSNKDMSLQGAWIGFTPVANGALCMSTQSDEAVYVSDVFDCGEAKGTWDDLHLHFEQLWELQVSVWMFDSASTREQLLEFSILDRSFSCYPAEWIYKKQTGPAAVWQGGSK